MARILESQSVDRQLTSPDELMRSSSIISKLEIKEPSNLEVAQEWYSGVPAQVWDKEDEELVPQIAPFKISGDSFEESDSSSSFHGVSHPPEPVDMELMRPVCVQIDQDNGGDGKFLVKSLPIEGPFLKSCPVLVPSIKLSPSALVPFQFIVHPLSQNTEANLMRDLEGKEGVCDSSLPTSANVSRHGSIDGISVANGCANRRHSDGIFNMDKTCESMKGSIRGNTCESSKTSCSRASDSSGLSDDSSWSNGSGNKPHKGNDPRWKAIHAVQIRDGLLGMSHFRLLKRLGCGDTRTVYLSELSSTQCYFVMKVIDKASLASCRKKVARAQMEKEILQLLDHPFLPTLYAHFETDRFSCLVMEYCPGGDLHSLRQRQPGKHLSEYAAQFYAAEVLLALEYLHMQGVVYRDLKPENILIRNDGHIMLSDFDLSLRSAVSPILIRSSGNDSDPATFCVKPSCIKPACFLPRLFSRKSKGKPSKSKVDHTISNTLPQLVAEPTTARSMSLVGTHEYLAPEVIIGDGHGSAVDWWTFGIFLYELLYGKTPFKGAAGNRATLFNIIGQQLKFPDCPETSFASRDLICRLLVKEPQNRLGVKRGATEIKQHLFFKGVNWALIRCSMPAAVVAEPDYKCKEDGAILGAGTDMKSGGKCLDFEFF